MTKPMLAIVYIPGLGDSRIKGQQWAVGFWRMWGIEPHIFPMHWQNNESWEVKQARLLTYIDGLLHEGKLVGLVGASAGAAAVINAYSVRKDKLIGCVIIAGKVNRPEVIGHHYLSQNPAFGDCVYTCQKMLAALTLKDRGRIQSRYAFFDGVVSKKDSIIPGAHNRKLLSIGHVITIALQITIASPLWLHFLKQRASSQV